MYHNPWMVAPSSFTLSPPPKKKIKKWLGTTIRLVLKGRGFEEVRILYWFNLYTTIHVHALYPVCILYLDHG